MGGQEMLRVREHVSRCPQCSEELDQLRSVKNLMASLPTRIPAIDFEAKLSKRVFAPSIRGAIRSATGFWLASTLAAAAAAFLVFHFLSVPIKSRSPVINQPIAYDVERDQAFIAGTDPLSGQAGIVNVSHDAKRR